MQSVVLFVIATTIVGTAEIRAQEFWQPFKNFDNQTILALTVDSRNTLFAASRSDGLWRTDDEGEHWDLVIGAQGIISIFESTEGSMLAGTSNGSLYRSVDGGVNWNNPTTEFLGHGVRTFTQTSDGALFLGTLSNGVFRSLDDGLSWTSVNQGLTSLNVQTLARNSADHLFCGMLYGGVVRSTNKGDSWEAVNNGLARFEESIASALLVLPDDRLILSYASFVPETIYISDDNGDTWTGVNPGYPDSFAQSLLVKQGSIYASTTLKGVYRSRDQGNSWSAVNDGLQELTTGFMTIDNSGHLYVGTNSAGIFRSREPVTSVASKGAGRPPELDLNIAPHPLVSGVRIVYTLQKPGHCELNVYSLDGRHVKPLVSQWQAAGKHEVHWQAESLPPGPYLCVLQAGVSRVVHTLLKR